MVSKRWYSRNRENFIDCLLLEDSMAKINVESTDVLIVGAGPVGLMLACEL
jgi:NADPH-dependent 2,4-dienoyl-CoA reductase/sulfur reductase-like enzyme